MSEFVRFRTYQRGPLLNRKPKPLIRHGCNVDTGEPVWQCLGWETTVTLGAKRLVATGYGQSPVEAYHACMFDQNRAQERERCHPRASIGYRP